MDGEISENPLSGFTAGAAPRWRFRLHSDTLSAADMDRWMGPRARPGWLQRPSLRCSVAAPDAADAGELLRRLDAEGDLSIDEFALEKLNETAARHASLRGLRLQMEKCQAQWAGGALQASVTAHLTRNRYMSLKLRATGIALAQYARRKSRRPRHRTLDGTLDLKTEGVGRDALLDKLTGEGHLQLKKIEFRGWDVSASSRRRTARGCQPMDRRRRRIPRKRAQRRGQPIATACAARRDYLKGSVSLAGKRT